MVGDQKGNPDSWTPDVWNRVYRFPKGITEGWAGRRVGCLPENLRETRTQRRRFQKTDQLQEL